MVGARTLAIVAWDATSRGVPIDAGEQMLTRLRPLFDALDAAVDGVHTFRHNPAGQLRPTVSPPVASFVLSPSLPEFVARYLRIIVDVSIDAALTDVVAGR